MSWSHSAGNSNFFHQANHLQKCHFSAQNLVWTHISHITTTTPVQPRKKQSLPSLLWWHHTRVTYQGNIPGCSPPPPRSFHPEQWCTACSCSEAMPQTEGTAQERANKHQKQAPNPQIWVCTAAMTHLGRLPFLCLPVLEACENRAGQAPHALPPSQHCTHSQLSFQRGTRGTHHKKRLKDWKASNKPQLKGEDWLETFLEEFKSFEERITCFIYK